MRYEKTLQDITYHKAHKNALLFYRDKAKDIRKLIEEFKSSFPEQFIKDKKIEYKKMIIADLENEVKCWAKSYQNSWKHKAPIWFRKLVKEFYNNAIKKLKKERTNLYFIENPEKIKEGKISQDMIVRAKNFPITELVEVDDRGFARCVSPEHEDKHASMYCKNNFAHCFSCNYSADVIKLCRDIYNITFVEAVKKLNNN